MKIAKEKETVSPLAEHHQATAREKISYSIYFLGQGLVYTIVSQCLMYYYTDSVLMAPAGGWCPLFWRLARFGMR